MQLLGGIWILQTFPAIVAGLYRAGSTGGHCSAAGQPESPTAPSRRTTWWTPVTKAQLGGSIAAIPGTDTQVYIAVTAFAISA